MLPRSSAPRGIHTMLRLDSIDGVVASASEPSPTHFQARSHFEEPSFLSNNQSASFAVSPHREFVSAPQANVDVRVIGAFRLACGTYVPHGVCWVPACVVDCHINAGDPSAHAVSCLVRYPLSRTAWEEWVPSSSLRVCRTSCGALAQPMSSAEARALPPGTVVEVCDCVSPAAAGRSALWFEAVVPELQDKLDALPEAVELQVEGCNVSVDIPAHRVFARSPQPPISSEQLLAIVADDKLFHDTGGDGRQVLGPALTSFDLSFHSGTQPLIAAESLSLIDACAIASSLQAAGPHPEILSSSLIADALHGAAVSWCDLSVGQIPPVIALASELLAHTRRGRRVAACISLASGLSGSAAFGSSKLAKEFKRQLLRDGVFVAVFSNAEAAFDALSQSDRTSAQDTEDDCSNYDELYVCCLLLLFMLHAAESLGHDLRESMEKCSGGEGAAAAVFRWLASDESVLYRLPWLKVLHLSERILWAYVGDEVALDRRSNYNSRPYRMACKIAKEDVHAALTSALMTYGALDAIPLGFRSSLLRSVAVALSCSESDAAAMSPSDMLGRLSEKKSPWPSDSLCSRFFARAYTNVTAAATRVASVAAALCSRKRDASCAPLPCAPAVYMSLLAASFDMAGTRIAADVERDRDSALHAAARLLLLLHKTSKHVHRRCAAMLVRVISSSPLLSAFTELFDGTSPFIFEERPSVYEADVRCFIYLQSSCRRLWAPARIVPPGVKPKIVYSQRRVAACLAMLRLLQSCAKREYGGSAVAMATSSLPVVLCKLAQGHDHSGLVARVAKVQALLLPCLSKKWRVKYPSAVNSAFCSSSPRVQMDATNPLAAKLRSSDETQAEAVKDMTLTLAACDRWAKLDSVGGGWKDGYPFFHGGFGSPQKDLTGISLFDCNNSSLLEQPTIVVSGGNCTSPPCAEALHPDFYSESAISDWIQVQRLLMRQVLASDRPVAAAEDILADRHYMQRGSGSYIVLGEADGLHDAAAACLAVGLLAKFERDKKWME